MSVVRFIFVEGCLIVKKTYSNLYVPINEPVLSLMFALSFYSHICLSVIHFTFRYLLLHACFFSFLDLEKQENAERVPLQLMDVALPIDGEYLFCLLNKS